MSRKKEVCKCPADVKKYCEHSKIGKTTECKDVAQIIAALKVENELRQKKQSTPKKKPKFKTKPFRPPPAPVDPKLRIAPPMGDRVRFISHCPPEPAKAERVKPAPFVRGPKSLRERQRQAEKMGIKPRNVSYESGNIRFQEPLTVVKHTESNESIFNVPSPKVSGEVIQAQRAVVKPALPPKSGMALYKPHSGIVVNAEKGYVATPDYHPAPPPGVFSSWEEPEPTGRPHRVCNRKTCNKKKCRKFAAMRRRQENKRLRRLGKFRSRGEVPHSAHGLATDGKPRARGARKHLMDDDDDLCGLDEIPKQEHAHIPANLKRGTLQTHSLTVLPCTKERRSEPVHYGILTGSFNMYDSKYGGRSRGRQALTMSVMAYCLAFHYHPKQWTMKLIDNLVDAGDAWYIQCADKVHDHSAVQGICEVLPFGKKQTLTLNGKKMQVLLGEPDIVGYTMSVDPTVYNLCRGLKAFFKDNRAGVLLTRVLKVVIWKDRICFYIFDPAGRDARGYSNFTNGCAALMNVASLEDLSEVLLARTILEDQKFVLASLKVLKMADEAADEDFESDKELTQAEKAMMGFRILNENCAIVNANMHLGDRCFEDARFRQAVPVAVVAMTYAKISPPNTWFTKTLDKILRLGNKLYLDCLQPKVMIDMTIDNIPNEITIGPYVCEIIIYRDRVKGQLFTTKECLFNIRSGLEDFFKHEHNSGILEFNNYSMAVWRQKDMFYLFDPYPRTNDGLRGFKTGRACCWMLLNPAAMASVFTKNWDFMPATTQFYIHAFKVLKLKKNQPKTALVCTLSDENIPDRKKSKRKILSASHGKGDGKELVHNVLPKQSSPSVKGTKGDEEMKMDEEQMGDIISLVDSIQEDYLPGIPMKYKNMAPEPEPEKVVNLDSPTVSVTQVVPPWPKPRDKTNELPEPDPDPEPTPPPTPPPPPVPEGAEEEAEEAAEEEEDEETLKAKKEEAARLKAEEEEARRKAEELPPPFPPPPPSPQGEPEELMPLDVADFDADREEEVQTVEPPVNVERKILLTEDAKQRFKLRQMRKKATPPLEDRELPMSPSQELAKPSNFHPLPDGSEIIRGGTAVAETGDGGNDILPFSAIMAIVISYKYCINTWTSGLVDFVVSTASSLYKNKKEKFQISPVHVIPKIGIGHQTYSAHIDVATEGPTWQMEEVLLHRFFTYSDRGMLTTPHYSCAFFKKNGLYYLYDGSACNAMGLRNKADIVEEQKAALLQEKGQPAKSSSVIGTGKACLMRFRNLHDLVARIIYNKDGNKDDQQFIVSKVIVRRLLVEPRMRHPEDYDYEKGMPKEKKSKTVIAEDNKEKKYLKDMNVSESVVDTRKAGYQFSDGVLRIEGTTSLRERKGAGSIKACHFVCLIAMLMATMHPLRKWDHQMVDCCIEKGLEIYDKAPNKSACEKRVIRNVMLGGKFININIKKITVINENSKKTLEQYMRAVLKRLRYVMVRYPEGSMVIVQTDDQYHLFDPYPAPGEEIPSNSIQKDTKEKAKLTKECPNASWTLYTTQEDLISRIRRMIKRADHPEFYTFELTSVQQAPRHAAVNYRLSPIFQPDENPNTPYLQRRRVRPLVDEKMYWLDIETVPWSRMKGTNDLGFDRNTPRTLWKEWDIEFPGDLYSLWGTLHPKDKKFDPKTRGQQYLATSVVAIVMTKICNLKAWTSALLDGIVETGNEYHLESIKKLGSEKNHEMTPEDLASSFNMYPFSFNVKFTNVIFGFVYNIFPDRFNLSKALDYFFEKHTQGLLTSSAKNLAFGKINNSYFMFDCQSYGFPNFCFGVGAAYIFKCESLNRLVYCMTMAINAKRHGYQFNLYSVDVTVSESSAKPKK